MQIAELPKNEKDRLNDLQQYKIMDTPSEVEFDDLVKLASTIAKVPMSLIALIDEKRQWFKSSIGIGFRETPREFSFCNHTILGNSPLVVNDTEKDERFCGNPYVTGAPGIRFYAGFPLMSYRGNPIGTLCVLDVSPKDLNEDQRFALYVLSRQVVKHLELKRINDNLEQVNKTQNLLLSIIMRDVKSPLAATGTFLNLLQTEVNIRFDMIKYAGIAARQFNRSLALLDSVMEWGRIYGSRRNSTRDSLQTRAFVSGLIADLNKISYSRSFSVTNTTPDVRLEVGFLRELSFIIHNSILWFLDCADSGEIAIEKIQREQNGVAIRITMTSKSLLKTISQSIKKLNSDTIWHNNPNLALDGLPFRLAKDITMTRNGSLIASIDNPNVIRIDIYAEII